MIAGRALPLLALSLAFLCGAGCSGPETEDSYALDVGWEYQFVQPPSHPDLEEWTERFENEGREIYERRFDIIEACGIQSGTTVADVGAGTGLFTMLLAQAVGPAGKVIALDVVEEFVTLIGTRAVRQGLTNVDAELCTQRSIGLPERTVDLAFLCDVYHYLEYRRLTMRSIHDALKDDGTLILIDFVTIPAEGVEDVMGQYEEGRRQLVEEVEGYGFEFVEDVPVLEESFFLRFRKAAQPAERPAAP